MNSKLKHEGDIIIIIKVWIFSCCLWILVGKWYFYSRVFIAWNCCSGYSYIGRVLKLFIYVYFFICLLSFEFSNLSTISINSRVIHYIQYINFIYLFGQALLNTEYMTHKSHSFTRECWKSWCHLRKQSVMSNI